MTAVMERVDWGKAACLHHPFPDLWFPTDAQEGSLDAARKICRRCPIRASCEAYAVSAGEQFGVWVGCPRSSAISADRGRHASAATAYASTGVGADWVRVGRATAQGTPVDRAPWEIDDLLHEMVVERFGFLHRQSTVFRPQSTGRSTNDPQAVDGSVRMTFAELIALYERERPPTPWEYARRRMVLMGTGREVLR